MEETKDLKEYQRYSSATYGQGLVGMERIDGLIVVREEDFSSNVASISAYVELNYANERRGRALTDALRCRSEELLERMD